MIEFLEDNGEATYEDLINKIQVGFGGGGGGGGGGLREV